MPRLNLNNYIRIFFYASIFWVCLGILHLGSLFLEEPLSTRLAYLSTARLVLFIGSYFFWSFLTVFLYFLIETHPPSKQNLGWIIYLALTTIVWLVIITIINQYLGSLLWNKKPELILTMLRDMPPFLYLFNLVKVLLVYSACTGIFFYTRMQDTKLMLVQLERETAENLEKKSRFQLQALQAQLSPHFLFNCLNSISSLARSQDSAAITTTVANLAGLLRYAIEGARQTQVNLEDEISITNHYIALQEIRFRGCFHFTMEMNVANTYMLCPPFCIQTLVENVFSHNELNASNPITIKVEIFQQENSLTIKVENTPVLPCHYDGTGVALKNLKERLDLLYKDEGKIATFASGNSFSATVTFPIRYEHD